MKDGVSFSKRWYTLSACFPPEKRCLLLGYCLSYLIDGEPPKIQNKSVETLFNVIKKEIDQYNIISQTRKESGKNGGSVTGNLLKQKKKICLSKKSAKSANEDTVGDNLLKQKNTVCLSKSIKRKEVTITTKLKQVFDDGYYKIYGEKFYWAPKEIKAITLIVEKLKFKMKTKNVEINDEQIISSFTVFLNNITDKWILQNFSPSIINSKFNEIITQIYARHSKRSDNVTAEAINILKSDKS